MDQNLSQFFVIDQNLDKFFQNEDKNLTSLGWFLSDQHILSQINRNTTTDFFRFTKIYKNCSKFCKF